MKMFPDEMIIPMKVTSSELDDLLSQHLGTPREKILSFEKSLFELNDYINLPLRHFTADDVYVREIFMPAGSLVVGKVHLHEHLNIISTGLVSCYTEEGCIEIRGHHILKSEPGTKRALFVKEDTIWSTIHKKRWGDIPPNNEKDINKFYVVETYEEFDSKRIGILP
jgi:hypothetical protein